MPGSAQRVLFATTAIIGLLSTACTSRWPAHAVSSTAPVVSPGTQELPSTTDDDTDLYVTHFPEQAPLIRTGKDFTIVPSGSYTPLPPNELLGARNLKQRDDILEVMVRHLATKPESDVKYRFLSFQGDRSQSHDHIPNEELLQRIRQLGLTIQPVSVRKESRMECGMRALSEQAVYGKEYSVVCIQVANEDSAEVPVNEMPSFGRGGQMFTYTLTRSNAQWKIIKEEPGPIS